MRSILVVIAYAKILILKQVTTPFLTIPVRSLWYCLRKDTNSQASHNSTHEGLDNVKVVIAYAKILILKQVTTLHMITTRVCVLLLSMQRYELFSVPPSLFTFLTIALN